MSTITLDLAKAHMRIPVFADAERDQLIQLYIDACERWAGNYIGKQLADMDPVPSDLQLAILQLIAFRYDQPSAVSFGVSMQLAPYGVTCVLNSYREEWFHDGE